MLFLFVGINMTANNRFNQFIISNLFYASSSSSILVRLLGIAILASFVLFLLGSFYYAMIVVAIVILIFTFFTIQGRAKAKGIAEKKRRELEFLHKAQMIERKRELSKTRKGKIKELEDKRNKPQSVQQMKDKMWNDGSMSNKDIIRDLKRD
jgi:ABC-type multidrug transport system fused ATPase/permease subunit